MAKDVLYFEDLKIGTIVKTLGRTITETDVIEFCKRSGDFRPRRCDKEYSKTYSPTGEVMADPLMIYCLSFALVDVDPVSAMVAKSILAFLGINDWKYLKPAKIGDTFHRVTETINLRDNRPDRGILISQLSLINQNGEVLQQGVQSAYIGKRCFFEK